MKPLIKPAPPVVHDPESTADRDHQLEHSPAGEVQSKKRQPGIVEQPEELKVDANECPAVRVEDFQHQQVT